MCYLGRMSNFRLRLKEKRRVAENVFVFSFRPQDGGLPAFSAGQHISLEIPTGGDTPVERLFSVASPPTRTEALDLIIKVKQDPSSSSHYFHGVEPGQVFSASGPKGGLIIRTLERPIMMIGAGTGVAPFMSMIPDLLEARKTAQAVRLSFFRKTGEYAELEDRLRDLASRHGNFSFSVIDDELNCALPAEDAAFSAEAEHYVCGNAKFVDVIKVQLTEKGIPEARIHHD